MSILFISIISININATTKISKFIIGSVSVEINTYLHLQLVFTYNN